MEIKWKVAFGGQQSFQSFGGYSSSGQRKRMKINKDNNISECLKFHIPFCSNPFGYIFIYFLNFIRTNMFSQVKLFWCLGTQKAKGINRERTKSERWSLKESGFSASSPLFQKRNDNKEKSIMDSEKKINGKRTTHMIFPKKKQGTKEHLKLWISSFYVPSGCTAQTRKRWKEMNFSENRENNFARAFFVMASCGGSLHHWNIRKIAYNIPLLNSLPPLSLSLFFFLYLSWTLSMLFKWSWDFVVLLLENFLLFVFS